MRLAREQASHVFSLKVAKHGGLLRTRKVAAIAQAADIGWYGGTMLETSIGSAASAHVFATLGGQHYNCELFGPSCWWTTSSPSAWPSATSSCNCPTGPAWA